MRGRLAATALTAGLLPVALAACQPQASTASAAEPRYEGAEAAFLDAELVRVTARMSGPATRDALLEYSRCAVARYALRNGQGFARHLRTNVTVEGGIRSADAVYTLSPTLPRGSQTIDAEVLAAACAEQGIPTV